MADETFELDLTEMVYTGNALGKHEGRTIFVPYGIADERVRARIVQDKGRYAFAEIDAVLDESPSRVVPRCPYFGRCGGCHWQHMDYPAQLEFKQQIVREQFRRIGGFQDVIVQPPIPGANPWYYRSHVSLHVTDNGLPGYIEIDGKTIIPIEECYIIRPELLDMLLSVRAQSAERVWLQVGTNGDERLIAINAGDEEAPYSNNQDTVHYTIKGRVFQVTAGSFFQVNLEQAELLVDLVINRLNLTGSESVLDLYSGVGLFTAFLAERAAQVTAVEIYPPAIKDAEVNLAEFDNVKLRQGTIEQVLPELSQTYDAAVVDPPRAGMKPRVLEALMQHAPGNIVYVSCDPATLARDAKQLANNGYQLLDVQPVDMFPQTYHIEAVATFVLNS